MSDELRIKIALEALIAERCAMEAANIARISNGLSLAYGEEEFNNLSQEMQRLAGS